MRVPRKLKKRIKSGDIIPFQNNKGELIYLPANMPVTEAIKLYGIGWYRDMS